MNKSMKKVLISTAAVFTLVIAMGIGALANEWLNFNGDEQSNQSTEHVNEIMEILTNENQKKITAEQALAELQKIDIEGMKEEIESLKTENAQAVTEIAYLNGEIETLQSQSDQNNEYIQHLESELTRANEAVHDHNQVTSEAVEQARDIGGQ